MTENHANHKQKPEIPEANIKSGRNLSLIWLVPLVAVLVGLGLGGKALYEKGSDITISFKSAEGLQAGKTKVKYKDVEIGVVNNIRLDENLDRVLVDAELDNTFNQYLHEETRFWVVRARIGSGKISGLNTLLSGAYISVDPVAQGEKARTFIGLDVPPIVTTNLPGKQFTLMAKTLDSMDIGSPIYYRQIQVGEVVSYNLVSTGESVELKIFIHAPYDNFVLENSRFWNASGINMSLDAEGVKVNTQSLTALLSGGISFSNFESAGSHDVAPENRQFELYRDRQTAVERKYSVEKKYLLYFDDSVRGLTVGAPVEVQGTKIGEVVDVNLQYNIKTRDFEVPVLISVEPERIKIIEGEIPPDANVIEAFVQKGLRAQLRTSNLLTGQLYVHLDFYPDSARTAVVTRESYKVLPTVPNSTEQIILSLTRSLKKIEKIPFGKIGEDLSRTLNEVNKLAETINSDITPAASKALSQLSNTLADIERVIGKNSGLRNNASNAFEELAAASRSIRALVESLEKNPEALLYGKKKEK